MSNPFWQELQVRDYELDQYGVVHNGVYLNYLEHARHQFLTAIGLDAARVAREGRALALSETHVTFRRPLRSRERFRVSVAVVELRGARVALRQQILRLPEGEPVLEAVAVAVFLDEGGRPMRVGPELRALFAPYLVPR